MHWQQAEKSGLPCHAIRQSKLLCSASPWSMGALLCQFSALAALPPGTLQAVPTSLFSTTQSPLLTILQRGTVDVHNSSALLQSWLDDLTELWLQQGSAPSPQYVAAHIR